jgi:hypothetical protein
MLALSWYFLGSLPSQLKVIKEGSLKELKFEDCPEFKFEFLASKLVALSK